MTEEAVPILRVADAEAAARWYARLGFAFGWEHRFEPGFPAFVEVHRGRVRLFLSEHEGDSHPSPATTLNGRPSADGLPCPDTLVYLRLNDIDAVAAEFGVPVEEAPWGRELELRDPDGNRLRVGEPED